MALTPSTMVELGSPAPPFRLPNPADGTSVSLDAFAGRPLLVMFICNHCPYVIHILPELRRLDADYGERLGLVAINSNSVITHPQDGPDNMAKLVEAEGWRFPFLFDEDQSVAHAYAAACTPDFFVYDADHRLYYRGQLDESRPGKGQPDGADLRAALDALLAGQNAPEPQWPSAGCNIKWND